jgi:hypothetical protein
MGVGQEMERKIHCTSVRVYICDDSSPEASVVWEGTDTLSVGGIHQARSNIGFRRTDWVGYIVRSKERSVGNFGNNGRCLTDFQNNCANDWECGGAEDVNLESERHLTREPYFDLEQDVWTKPRGSSEPVVYQRK